jgi:rhamnogalacturonan endolyase
VNAPDAFTPRTERAAVSGRIESAEPCTNLMVGLADPSVDWQKDAKFYEFWTRAGADGRFTMPNVRPGKYTLHAFATGILGELTQTGIEVTAGRPLDLGTIRWNPLRHGRQLWDIGIPDRTAGEFRHGDQFFHWGIYNQYLADFPHDVHFVIGKSDYHKDWNLMQVPRAHDQTGRGRGDATTWTVSFDLPSAPHGTAWLRLAFAGTEARSLSAAMNGKFAGSITGLPNTMAIHRDSDRSYWAEHDLVFDASLMKAGTNELKLTVPAGPVTAGIEYDYLRLELDESAKPPPAPYQTPAPVRGGDSGRVPEFDN